VRQYGAIEPRSAKIRTGHIGRQKVGFPQVRETQIGVRQCRAPQVRLDQDDVSEVGSGKVGFGDTPA